MSDSWRVVYVDDEKKFRDDVKDFLEGAEFEHGALSVLTFEEFDGALTLLKDRKVDLLILDVFDAPISELDAAGIEVLARWKTTGFAPVVFYTALPRAPTGSEPPQSCGLGDGMRGAGQPGIE